MLDLVRTTKKAALSVKDAKALEIVVLSFL